jgi:hypothetical protein
VTTDLQKKALFSLYGLTLSDFTADSYLTTTGLQFKLANPGGEVIMAPTKTGPGD